MAVKPDSRGLLQLPPQDGARRNRDQVVGPRVLEIAEDESGAVEPGGGPERGQVGDHVEVAVAQLPVGVGVPGDRLHLHVDGQQVVAAVGPVVGDLLDEMVGVESLAVDPAVVVGERHHHGVDVAGRDAGLQLVTADHPSHPSHRILLLDTPRTGSRE